jgi:hypothetical protein
VFLLVALLWLAGISLSWGWGLFCWAAVCVGELFGLGSLVSAVVVFGALQVPVFWEVSWRFSDFVFSRGSSFVLVGW